jgi:hypothetical protein
VSKAARRAGRNNLREGIRRDVPAHRDHSVGDIPTQPDVAARLAAIKTAAAQRKTRRIKK